MRQENETKYIKNRKEEVKVSLFADGMMISIEDPKESTKQHKETLKTINQNGQLQSQHKKLDCIHFLNENNDSEKKEIQESIPIKSVRNY